MSGYKSMFEMLQKARLTTMAALVLLLEDNANGTLCREREGLAHQLLKVPKDSPRGTVLGVRATLGVKARSQALPVPIYLVISVRTGLPIRTDPVNTELSHTY